MAFTGFPRGARTFLAELAENNDRAWFAENRERYDRDLLGPEREFVEAIGTAYASIDRRVRAEPAVNRSIFRINRDIRFSKDKSPYKTHADMWFWVGDDRKNAPAGYFVRVVPDAVWVGGGVYQPTDAQISRYRSAVVDELHGLGLERVLTDLAAAGYRIGDQTLKRVPSGFSAQHPRAGLLRYTRLHAVAETSPPPMELESSEFVGWCTERFVQVKPLIDWLADQLGGMGSPDHRV